MLGLNQLQMLLDFSKQSKRKRPSNPPFFFFLVITDQYHYCFTMPIIYTLIARGTTVLCECFEQTGNFAAIARRIIAKIPQTDSQMSYIYETFLSIAPHF